MRVCDVCIVGSGSGGEIAALALAPGLKVVRLEAGAERYMGIYGNKDGLWNLPDGEYSKPIGMRCGEQLLTRGVERLKAKGACNPPEHPS